MTETLTERQEKILAFIKRSIQEQGYPPTIREIGEHFGIRSTNGVNDHLKALERKGYLVRGELKSRALSVIEGGKPARFGVVKRCAVEQLVLFADELLNVSEYRCFVSFVCHAISFPSFACGGAIKHAPALPPLQPGVTCCRRARSTRSGTCRISLAPPSRAGRSAAVPSRFRWVGSIRPRQLAAQHTSRRTRDPILMSLS